MNKQQLESMEKELWDSANNLRANSKLTAAEYKDPVLGLMLLRYAQNRYEQVKTTVEASIPRVRGRKRPAVSNDYKAAGAMMLPEKSQYDYLANLPDAADICDAVNHAMKLIEDEYPDLEGVLPRSYQEMDADLLRELIRVFNKDAVRKINGDAFGRIYEFFLMKFSMAGAGAQEGGEFFTPPSLVQLIVNMIQPDHGVVHDPACGSGGMFVQTGHFIAEHKGNQAINESITCFGSELKANNAKLAKMNLAIHGIEGKIAESNSFYSDPHNLIGQCDFVMANPPFNVKKVDKKKDYVKSDPRLFTDVGIPKADNGNYLWIQYFYHYLNDQGRAGFVMASSATDAGNTEKAIRQKLIETGAVDCIVAVGNNFFYTRSLPCHVWFLDKGKRPENKNRILMIDARHTFRVVTNTINDYSPGQLRNFMAIMGAYRGDASAIADANCQHQKNSVEMAQAITAEINQLRERCREILAAHDNVTLDFSTVLDALAEVMGIADDHDYPACFDLIQLFENPVEQLSAQMETYQSQLEADKKAWAALTKKDKTSAENKTKKKQLDTHNKLLRVLMAAIGTHEEALKADLANYKQQVNDWHTLLEHFPDNQYRDIEGLCKIVNREEVAENDYSLTPGRYVGYSIQIDEDFDYQGRMKEIQDKLAKLNNEALSLFSAIDEINL